jgi:hypothetical protein
MKLPLWHPRCFRVHPDAVYVNVVVVILALLAVFYLVYPDGLPAYGDTPDLSARMQAVESGQGTFRAGSEIAAIVALLALLIREVYTYLRRSRETEERTSANADRARERAVDVAERVELARHVEHAQVVRSAECGASSAQCFQRMDDLEERVKNLADRYETRMAHVDERLDRAFTKLERP